MEKDVVVVESEVEQVKKHWHLFVLSDGHATTSSYYASLSKKIKLKNIKEVQDFHQEKFKTSVSVVLNICYLGYMTAEEFNDE